MKLPCEMVQDLLPLYYDGVCSEVSKTLVTAHLAECDDCAHVLQGIDAEIVVPEAEVKRAQPLVSISMKWNKEKRRTLLRCLAAGALVFLLFVGCWWGLTQWYIVPLEMEEYIIRENLQFSNGYVYVSTSDRYNSVCVGSSITEDGRLYLFKRHTVLAEEAEATGRGSGGVCFLPGVDTHFTEDGEEVVITAVYVGELNAENAILLWEEGMAVRQATPEEEKEYQGMLISVQRVKELRTELEATEEE